jgi:hypothetical protein
VSEPATHFVEIVKTEVEPGKLKVNSWDGKMKLNSEEDMVLRLGWQVEREGAEHWIPVDGKAWHFIYREQQTRFMPPKDAVRCQWG